MPLCSPLTRTWQLSSRAASKTLGEIAVNECRPSRPSKQCSSTSSNDAPAGFSDRYALTRRWISPRGSSRLLPLLVPQGEPAIADEVDPGVPVQYPPFADDDIRAQPGASRIGAKTSSSDAVLDFPDASEVRAAASWPGNRCRWFALRTPSASRFPGATRPRIRCILALDPSAGMVGQDTERSSRMSSTE